MKIIFNKTSAVALLLIMAVAATFIPLPEKNEALATCFSSGCTCGLACGTACGVVGVAFTAACAVGVKIPFCFVGGGGVSCSGGGDPFGMVQCSIDTGVSCVDVDILEGGIGAGLACAALAALACTVGCSWWCQGACSFPGECRWWDLSNNSETGTCGGCGFRSRTCTIFPINQACHWGSWGSCTCYGTQNENQSCGNCGTKTRTCSSSSSCNWGGWSSCQNEGVCSSGSNQSEACGNCGTRSRTCFSSCSWGSWGSSRTKAVLPVLLKTVLLAVALPVLKPAKVIANGIIV